MDLNELLSYSIDSGASDLHLSVGSIPMVRINGSMKPLNMDVLEQADMESILPQVMNEDQMSLFKEKKEIVTTTIASLLSLTPGLCCSSYCYVRCQVGGPDISLTRLRILHYLEFLLLQMVSSLQFYLRSSS